MFKRYISDKNSFIRSTFIFFFIHFSESNFTKFGYIISNIKIKEKKKFE